MRGGWSKDLKIDTDEEFRKALQELADHGDGAYPDRVWALHNAILEYLEELRDAGKESRRLAHEEE